MKINVGEVKEYSVDDGCKLDLKNLPLEKSDVRYGICLSIQDL